jgi:hypothetical protein
VILVAVWSLSAQAPAPSEDIEKRLSALEGLIRKGPGNSTQVSGPFEVIGAAGSPILMVTDQRTGSARRFGRIHIGRGTADNFYVKVLKPTGQIAAQMLETKDGVGSFDVYDAENHLHADLYGKNGLNVYGPGEKPIITLAPDPAGGNTGALTIMSPAGKVLATMKGAQDGSAGAVSVMNAAGKPVAGLIGGSSGNGAVAVANSGGVTLAEMSVSNDGRGLVQIFGGAQQPLAVLTQAKENTGGLLQISSSAGVPVASFTVGQAGGGYWQLTTASGDPTVEAGTLPSGRGTVRVGPKYKCFPVQAATPVMSVGFLDCIVGGQ